jgi:hypothetical protein
MPGLAPKFTRSLNCSDPPGPNSVSPAYAPNEFASRWTTSPLVSAVSVTPMFPPAAPA